MIRVLGDISGDIMEELKHHGIKGMKWGVRRSKAQLARLSGRKEEDISDEEAKAFKKDVKRVEINDRSPSRKVKLYNKNKAEKGKEYADAVAKQAARNKVTKAVAGAAAVAVGKKAVEAYANHKLGIVHLENGTTLYTKPKELGR